MSYDVGRVLCSTAVKCRVIVTWDALRGIPYLKMGSGLSQPPQKFKEFDNATENLTRAARVQKRDRELNSWPEVPLALLSLQADKSYI